MVADVDPLQVSEEMLQFLEQHLPRDTASHSKAFTLAYTTLDPYLLAFKYDPSITLSAEEAFRKKTGNCLSFSNLFIALARAAGLKAWYQEVEVPQNWSNINETLLIGKHVNAVVEGSGSKFVRSHYVVDVSREGLADESTSHKISDDEARAQFYNNLGADALVDEELAEAYAYFAKGIETAPGISYIWSNLGVVLRRNNQPEDAKSTYLVALELNPGDLVALNNLYSLYLEEGNESEAKNVHARVERHRHLNPFYLQQLSTEAVEEQRYDDAITLLKQAIKIDGNEYRFHLALARTLLLDGNEKAAQLSLNRAKQLAPADRKLSNVELIQLADGTDI